MKAVADTGGALKGGVAETAEPDRDAPPGQGVEAGTVDAMPVPVEVDDGLVPEAAQHFDLLLLTLASVGELLVKGVVLDVVPTGPDTEAEATAREDVDFSGLLRDEHSLALGQDDDTRHQFHALGDGGEVAEQHEGLVEGGLVRVRAPTASVRGPAGRR